MSSLVTVNPGDPCIFCDGSGLTPEQHEPWATEWLACQDCFGTGRVPDPAMRTPQEWLDWCERHPKEVQGE
jgi:DnaJ-class molecular chaperone